MASIADDLRGRSAVDFGESALGDSLASPRLAGPPLRGRRDDVVHRAGVARARPPRRGRVRASGDRRQAGPAGRQRRLAPIRSPALRSLVRAGDVVLAVEPPTTRRRRRRHASRRAWGADDVWIGAGLGPPTERADHVLWVDDDGEDASPAFTTGGWCCVYHVLWELTHVCFEHPGLLQPATASMRPTSVCITCSDEGRLGEVIAVRDAGRAHGAHRRGIETIDTHPRRRRSRPGDLVLVHAGDARSSEVGRERRAPTSSIPFIEADERDAGALLADLGRVGTWQGRGQRRAATHDARAFDGDAID